MMKLNLNLKEKIRSLLSPAYRQARALALKQAFDYQKRLDLWRQFPAKQKIVEHLQAVYMETLYKTVSNGFTVQNKANGLEYTLQPENFVSADFYAVSPAYCLNLAAEKTKDFSPDMTSPVFCIDLEK